MKGSMIMHYKKIMPFFLLLLLIPMITACGKTKDNAQNNESISSSSSSSQPALKVSILRGPCRQCEGLISVPVIMKNQGTNGTVIDSNNFYLDINGRKLNPYQIKGEPSDFHVNFAPNNIYQNTITFNLNKQVTSRQLRAARLIYIDDHGNSNLAKSIGKNVNLNSVKPMLSGTTTTDLGTYYSQSKDYLKQIAKEKKSNPDATIPSLEERFNDKDYDQLRIWVAIPATGTNSGKNAVVKILNDTQTDFTLNYGDIELVDKNSNEYQVAPEFRNYSVFVPHGKYTTLVVPFEIQLRADEQPYHIEIRKDQTGNNPTGDFMDTKGTFNPIETIFSKEVSPDVLFSLNPDKYPAKSIKWGNPKIDLNSDTVKATVQLQDYFNLDNQSANYQLISQNDDGQRKIVNISRVTPSYIMTTDPTRITWKIKGLSDIMSYQHVTLTSNGKSVLQLK